MQREVVNGQCSDWTRVKSGTPEGAVLSLLLFSMYINEPSADIFTSKIVMFTDDVKIYRKVDYLDDIAHLQDDLNRICFWSKKWMLTLNPAKCKHFRMTLKRQPLTRTYDIDGTDLEHVEEVRDLGVKLN